MRQRSGRGFPRVHTRSIFLALLMFVATSTFAQTALDRAKQRHGAQLAAEQQLKNVRTEYLQVRSDVHATVKARVQEALSTRPLPDHVSLAYLLGFSERVNAPWDETASARAVELTRKVMPGCLNAMDELVLTWYQLSEEISSSSDRAPFSHGLWAACDRTPEPFPDWNGGSMGYSFRAFLDTIKQDASYYYNRARHIRILEPGTATKKCHPPMLC